MSEYFNARATIAARAPCLNYDNECCKIVINIHLYSVYKKEFLGYIFCVLKTAMNIIFYGKLLIWLLDIVTCVNIMQSYRKIYKPLSARQLNTFYTLHKTSVLYSIHENLNKATRYEWCKINSLPLEVTTMYINYDYWPHTFNKFLA